jgi:hypothetical protein
VRSPNAMDACWGCARPQPAAMIGSGGSLVASPTSIESRGSAADREEGGQPGQWGGVGKIGRRLLGEGGV